MIRLYVLGTPTALDLSGAEVDGLIGQSKRLGLLGYLLLTRPRGFVGRSRLLPLFWPDSPEDRARAALNSAIYFLRRHLGAEAILTRGDEVAVNRGWAWCDAVEFEDALQAGELGKALRLYRADLLDGVSLPDAPEFDRWLDSERMRLRDQAAAGALALCESALEREDASDVVEWASRAVELSTGTEEVLRRAMRAVESTGESAVALRLYHEAEAQLSEELEIELSADTRALADAIREQAGPGAGAGTAQAARAAGVGEAPPLALRGDPSLVLVLPFGVPPGANIGYLSEGIVDLLGLKLHGAGPLRAVDPTAVISAVGSTCQEITRAEAVELAVRFGAGLHLRGRVDEDGEEIRITATLQEVHGGDSEVMTVTGGADRLSELVDALARKMIATRYSGAGERMTRLGAATTERTSALKAFLQGQHAFRHGRQAAAVHWFSEAVADDPEFALAWYRLGIAQAWRLDMAAATRSAEQAVRHAGNLSQHDRCLVEAHLAWRTGYHRRAERLYEETIADSPHDVEAWYQLGEVLFHYRAIRNRDLERTEQAFQRVLELDATNVEAMLHLVRLYGFEGRHDLLPDLLDQVIGASAPERRLEMEALRAFSLGGEAEQAEVVAALKSADLPTQLVTLTGLAQFSRNEAALYPVVRTFSASARDLESAGLAELIAAIAEVAFGRWTDASAHLQRAAAALPADALVYRAYLAAIPHLAVGATELRSIVADLESLDPLAVPVSTHPTLAVHTQIYPLLRLYLLGLLHVRLGALETAFRTAELLGRMKEPERSNAPPGIGHALAAAVRAQVLAARGEHFAALGELDRARITTNYMYLEASPVYFQAHEQFLRAEMLRACGRDDDALLEYASFFGYGYQNYLYRSAAHLASARLLSRVNARAAGRHYARVVALWSEGDEPLRDALAEAAAAATSLRHPAEAERGRW